MNYEFDDFVPLKPIIEELVFYTGPIISKKEAKEKGLKRYFTGKACLRGHIAERNIGRICVECAKINIEKTRTSKKRYEYVRNYIKNKRHNDIQFYLRDLLRSRICHALKSKGKRAGSSIKDLGCSINELKIYLESKFLPGMTWENRGLWHIDHIKPLACFDLTNREQFIEACHYTNLQPLLASDNIRKKKKYIF